MSSIFDLPTMFWVEFYSTLVALWLLSSSTASFAYRLGMGRFFSWFLIAWITTAPETISCIVYATRGLPTTTLFNAVYSAVFDLYLVIPLFAIYWRLGKSEPLIVNTYPFTWFIVTALLLTLCVLDLPSNLLRLDWCIDGVFEGLMLTIACIVITSMPLAYYVKVRGEKLIRKPKEKSPGEVVTDLLSLMSSLLALGFTSWQFAERVSILATFLPQNVVGVLSAYLTSLPDAIYASTIIYEDPEDSIGEVWSCVIHDFTESLGLPIVINKLLFGVSIAITMSIIDITIALLTLILFAVIVIARRGILDNTFIIVSLTTFTVLTLMGVGLY